MRMFSKKVKLDTLSGPSETHFKSTNNEIITISHNIEANSTIQIPALFESALFWSRFYDIECRLNTELRTINFLSSNISAAYNPIEYAADLHCDYLRKFLNGPKSVLFVGMNPGPYGMVQTGVPFGCIPAVKDWLKLNGAVEKPERELAARPVTGLSCKRNEQSGKRFWGLIQDLSGKPETFFRNCFVHNLCPLAFFHESGRNLTPVELQSDLKKLLQSICLKYLKEVIDLLSPKIIISIGRYAEDRVNQLFKNYSINEATLHKCIPHPSPRSTNNTKWNVKAKECDTRYMDELSYWEMRSMNRNTGDFLLYMNLFDLHNHMQIHTKKYDCRICMEIFDKNDDPAHALEMHMLTLPIRENIFLIVCSKGFGFRTSLVRHTRIHSGRNPFQCKNCQKAFREKDYLLAHQRIHNADKTVDRTRFTWKCSNDRKFRQSKTNSRDSKKRKRLEKVFKCKICFTLLKKETELNSHFEGHTGKFLFECNKCGRSFDYRPNLFRHMQIHSDLKPFKCTLCPNTYRDRPSLSFKVG